MTLSQRIAPCLWFDSQAEEAARFYVSVFPNSRIVRITHYGQAGFETHGQPAGTVLTVQFELDGQPFLAMNGGPAFTFNEAISLEVTCQTQAEVDYYWERLSAGGDPAAQVCGWLKDRFGVSWQVAPSVLYDMLSDPVSPASERAMSALMAMQKLIIADLERAYRGQ